jgi:hypothetical protein
VFIEAILHRRQWNYVIFAAGSRFFGKGDEKSAWQGTRLFQKGVIQARKRKHLSKPAIDEDESSNDPKQDLNGELDRRLVTLEDHIHPAAPSAVRRVDPAIAERDDRADDRRHAEAEQEPTDLAVVQEGFSRRAGIVHDGLTFIGGGESDEQV